MSNPFIGEVRIMGFAFAPKYWAQCNGQVLAIAQNQALFSILGTAFGGDGVRTFQLPDFRGRLPVHWGAGSFPAIGARTGEEGHTLQPTEQPPHTHQVSASTTAGNSQYIATVFPTAARNVPAQVNGGLYGPAQSTTTLHPSSIATAGGGAAHENRQPYTVLNFCIALSGIFPSRN